MIKSILVKKYLQVTKLGWEKTLKYRLNFFLGQLRALIMVFILYFLYTAIFTGKNTLFGFDREKIITYVLLSNVLFSFVYQYSMHRIADGIALGTANAIILKPISFFWFNFFQSISERFLNLIFSVFSISIFYVVIRPTLFIQYNIGILAIFILATVVSSFMLTILENTAGLFAFWMQRAVGPRFLFNVFVETVSGRYFPIQILPGLLVKILKLLPMGYLLFFPLNIYFGLISNQEIISSFVVLMVWLVLSVIIYKYVWNKGMKAYGAYGG